jgi:hypothetical protein
VQFHRNRQTFKRWLLWSHSTRLHGAISQKFVVLIASLFVVMNILKLIRRSIVVKMARYNADWSQGGSVSIVSDYRLDDRGLMSRGTRFFLLVSEAHSASYPMGTGDLPPGVKRGRGVTLTTHSL